MAVLDVLHRNMNREILKPSKELYEQVRMLQKQLLADSKIKDLDIHLATQPRPQPPEYSAVLWT